MTTETIEIALFVVFALAGFTFVMCCALRAEVTDLRALQDIQDDRAHHQHERLTEIQADHARLWGVLEERNADDGGELDVPEVDDTPPANAQGFPLTRPAYCCGVCPEISGGGVDCTCRNNPRCPGPDMTAITTPVERN